MNELTRADVTAVSVYQAAIQVPGRVIPRDPVKEKAILNGEQVFDRIGCAACHIPRLALTKKGWIYSEPNPFNPPGNLRMGETKTLHVDLTSDLLPAPRLHPDRSGTVWVEAYTDFKLHDICEPGDPGEPLDMNQPPWSKEFAKGNRRFLTKRLWGAYNEPPYFHHGLFTTMRRAVLAHAGEALESRKSFEALPAYDKDSLIEFLKTLQVLPPGTKDRIVDENFRPREWPPTYVMDPASHSARKIPYPKPQTAQEADQLRPPTEPLGTQHLEGFESNGTRSVRVIKIGEEGNDRPIQIESQTWYSKELQVVMMNIHRDPRRGDTVYQLKDIKRGVPSRTLFEVPADYTITTWSP